MSDHSAQADVLVEQWLHIKDRGAVDRLERAHPHAESVDSRDLDPVESDGIWAARRPGAEDSLRLSGSVAARVNTQYVPPSPIEPGEEKHLLAQPEISKAVEDLSPTPSPVSSTHQWISIGGLCSVLASLGSWTSAWMRLVQSVTEKVSLYFVWY
jgi:hypothetical protein